MCHPNVIDADTHNMCAGKEPLGSILRRSPRSCCLHCLSPRSSAHVCCAFSAGSAIVLIWAMYPMARSANTVQDGTRHPSAEPCQKGGELCFHEWLTSYGAMYSYMSFRELC